MKVVLIVAALVGSVLCEPPVGLGFNLGLANYPLHGGYAGLGSGGYGGAYVQPAAVIAGHQPYTVLSPQYGPSAAGFALSFDKSFNFGGGLSHAAPVVKHVAAAPVVYKEPVVAHHNYDYNAFQPIVKKPVVYKAPSHYHGSSDFSITPSISYGYSYKLVPTNNYGPVVSGGYGAPAVKHVHVSHHDDGHGHQHHGGSLGFNLNLDLGHQNHHHHH